ncbi:MAG: TRAP transporter large permease subunit [Anaerolineales bacterium]|nr:MAG: TRAP transporter large permease subunit [Anaerolineales bacterium]
MSGSFRHFTLAFLLLFIILGLILPGENIQAQGTDPAVLIIGSVKDQQEQPVVDARVVLAIDGENNPLTEATTQADGRYALVLPKAFPDTLSVHIERSHFQEYSLRLSLNEIRELGAGETIVMQDVTLQRLINPAFWVATLVFVLVLGLIATGIIHNTLAALVGVTVLFGVSYLGSPLSDGLFIFDFTSSMRYIDWNVIFLIMGMMIVIAVVENTGIFQWLAFFAYRVSGGRTWLLLPILMLITGIASAFLDNVTTMLLMTPITVQISLALGINPLALLIPEVMASNVIGVSTLVGTPTNILIGSYGNISFNDFLVNLTPGILMAFVGLLVYSFLVYRRELAVAHDASPLLIEKLAERGQITEPEQLRKAAVVFAGMLILFVIGEQFHMLPAVTALMGATVLLIWIRPDIEEMIEAVDWTTLVFFMSLFIVVGGIQEVGLISMIADAIARMVGDSLLLTMLAVTWLSALLSMVIANIPFTAAMLPVIAFLTATVPGADSKVLFFCLSVGAAMGGNGSLIGASANMVTAGISEAAGYPITYSYFIKKGFPALLITVALAMVWLLIRFL